jgi:dUTP pyrophosphatase
LFFKFKILNKNPNLTNEYKFNTFIKDQKFDENLKPTLVRTGIKVYTDNPTEEFRLSMRSGNALKRGWTLGNGIGIIDFDYCNNIDNEGELGFLIINNSFENFEIKPGMRIGQGTWNVLLHADKEYEDSYKRKTREGGFGHTGL